ncbi:MAG: sigma-70 family RNA polymerase sigma factor [Bacteroidales bacterium]|nr:sigma-70 family RNA polymerase sigma factor [Bacteroidales bacterium]
MKRCNLNDYDLVKLYIDGDHSSIETLIERHKNKVFSYIFLMVKKQEIAEDIFQDTFIKVIKSLKNGKYKDEGRFVSWVIRIAHNLVIDNFRKEKNTKTYSNDDNDLDIFNSNKFSDQNIEECIINDQITKDVRLLIDKLPKEQRDVIILRHYMELSFKEIAEQTDVSINTALGRMRYALINLRKLINEKNIILTLS